MSDFNPDDVREALSDKPSNTHNEQRYTISFINGTPGLVVREDYPADMEQAIRDILPIFKRFKEAVEAGKKVSQASQPSSLKAICKIHGVEMEEKDFGKGPFFSHRASDGWCNGKKITPFKERSY